MSTCGSALAPLKSLVLLFKLTWSLHNCHEGTISSGICEGRYEQLANREDMLLSSSVGKLAVSLRLFSTAWLASHQNVVALVETPLQC